MLATTSCRNDRTSSCNLQNRTEGSLCQHYVHVRIEKGCCACADTNELLTRTDLISANSKMEDLVYKPGCVLDTVLDMLGKAVENSPQNR